MGSLQEKSKVSATAAEGSERQWITKGDELCEKKKYQEALISYRKALEINPKSKGARYGVIAALSQADLEKHSKAEDAVTMDGKQETKYEPRVSMKLTPTSFRLGIWSRTEVTLLNEGNDLARNISLDFPSKVRVRGFRPISELGVDRQKNIQVDLMATEASEFPLDVQISCVDTQGKEYKTTKTFWLNVSRPHRRLPEIPGYEILRLISSGGFADIYQAKQREDGRLLAVMIPQLAPEHPVLATEFAREAELWSKMSHPHIVKVHEYAHKPYPWIATEYMDGDSLRDRIGKLGIIQSLQIGIRLAEALSYARSLGITHLNIRPEKILFDLQDVPKLTDWALGKIVLKASESLSGFQAASPYAAPEQVLTDFGAADWRTDIYRLGAVLYEMLTGELPFHGEGLAVVHSIRTEKIRKPSELNPRVREDLDLIILACLAKHKGERYQDVLPFKADLERVARMYRMKVLVIEDDRNVIETISLSFQIRLPEAKLVSTHLGQKGIELVRSQSPDVIILDIGLPDISGFDVLERIRRFSAVPVLILTARAEETNVLKGIKGGANDYMIKPFSPLDLVARTRAVTRI